MLLDDGVDGDTILQFELPVTPSFQRKWRSEKVLDQLNGRQNQSA